MARKVKNSLSIEEQYSRQMAAKKKPMTPDAYLSPDFAAYKIRKLVDIVNFCLPDHAQSAADIYPEPAIRAIAEMNKMCGHYAPEKHFNVNATLASDPDVKRVSDLMLALIKKNDKPF